MAKSSKVKNVATTTPAQNVATAPQGGVAHVVGVQGKSTAGGHVAAWRALNKSGGLPLDGVVAVQGANPWRPGCPSYPLFGVLQGMSEGSTVAEALVAAKAAGIAGAHSKLVWLYTWGTWLSINGSHYTPAQPFAVKPVAA